MKIEPTDAWPESGGVAHAAAQGVGALRPSEVPPARLAPSAFFREPDTLDFLTNRILPELCACKAEGSTLRVWVPTCGTGEEAYSFAVLLHEYVEAASLPLGIQVFATDTDTEALQLARRASYPAAIAADVTPERLRRFFHDEGGRYRVNARVRDSVVFSNHDLSKDPAFAKIDLISCRNFALSSAPLVRVKLLRSLHYSLAEHRYLVLGLGDSLAPSDLFAVVDARGLVLRRNTLPWQAQSGPDSAPAPQRYSEAPPSSGVKSTPRADPRQALGKLVTAALFEGFIPACVVVNESDQLVYSLGPVGKYLRLPEGATTVNLLELAHPELRPVLRACVTQARANNARIDRHRLPLQVQDETELVDLSVKPLPGLTAELGPLLIVFREAVGDRTVGEAGSEASAPVVQHLRDELAYTEQRLTELANEFDASAEELRHSNAELYSMNEELQSVNEELATAKEELQSMNEELQSLNLALKNRVEQLSHANSDIRNLFESTQIATVFLDADLKIRNFTPTATELFSLIPTDRGRPIWHIAQLFAYDALDRAIRDVLSTLAPRESLVRSSRGAWYILRILPYRSLDNVIEGVVLTFSDITDLKKAELEIARLGLALRAELRALKTMLELVPVGIAVFDSRASVVRTNRAAAELFGARSGAANSPDNDPLPYVFWREGREHASDPMLIEALTSGRRLNGSGFELCAAAQPAKHVLVHSAQLTDDDGQTYGQVSAIVDVSEIKRAKESAVLREHQQGIIAELGLRALEQADLAAFLRESLDLLRAVANVERAEVLRFDREQHLLRPLARSGWEDPNFDELVPAGSVTERLLMSHESVVLERTNADGEEWPEHLPDGEIRSGVRVPISAGETVNFGVLGVYTREERGFSAQDLNFLRTFANVFTSAIQRTALEDARLRDSEAATMKRTQEQLQRSEKLASLGTFAAGLAHELNNPLNTIVMSAEYLRTGADETRKPKILERIEVNAARCGRIVESVLSFARDENTQRWPNDLHGILRHAADLSRGYLAGQPSVQVSFEPCAQRAIVHCNPTEIEQIFVNLLRNAAQAKPSGAQVRIRTLVAGGSVSIVFTDNGPGIEPTLIQKIFDPFFSTKRKSGGTGLGLSITYRIVVAHGGSISVANAPEGGAEFTLQFPLAPME